ncbi:MAG: minor capsid protein [Inoviridae sp.]|nr:MAG: minor capsid protein [Inoviridae sp.]
MNRLIKPLLLITLAAFSFFAHSSKLAEYVQPKTSSDPLGYCEVNYGTNLVDVSIESCSDAAYSALKSTFNKPWTDSTSEFTNKRTYFYQSFDYAATGGTSGTQTAGSWLHTKDTESKICPPDDAPLYRKGPMTAPDGTEDICMPNIPLCPDGYYNFEIGGSCLPVQCPSSGTQMQGNIQTYGKLGLTSSGTWCDGICSYTVQPGAIDYSGSKWASGTATGKVCGGGKVESNSNFTSIDDENTCNDTIIPTGGLFQNCSTTEPEAPNPDDTLGGDDAPADNNLVDTTPDDPFTPQDCVVNGSEITCVGSNIVDALNDRASKQKENDDERHNKLVQQQKDVADYLEKKENEREAIRLANQDVLINSVNALGTTISSGSTSNADMTGVEAGLTAIGDSIGQTDVETDGEPTAGIESFYEREYPNGFSDVWEKNSAAFDNTSMNQYLKSWELTASGSAPSYEFCFNLGGLMDFGCSDIELDPRIFDFLRIIILVSTAFLCRSLIFGG